MHKYEDTQSEEDFMAQLKLETRLENGFDRVIGKVLEGKPIPLAAAALRVVSGRMLVCILSNLPVDLRHELIDGYLEFLREIARYEGMSPHTYQHGLFKPDYYEIRDVEHFRRN